MDHALHITSGEVVGFEIVACDVLKAGFVGLDQGADDYCGRHLSDTHQHELEQRYSHAADSGGNPQEEWAVVEEDDE